LEEIMLLKTADNKDGVIAELERLLAVAPTDRKAKIDHELRTMRAGIKAESETAYLIDFDFKASKNKIVIHDLRLEVGGRVAQIDHLLMDRTLTVFVLETKHFHAGLKITEDGEFLRWNDFKKTYEGMASPLAQNQRHIAVLKDAFGEMEMPTRLGVRLSPTFESYVLVSGNSRIDRPKKYDTSQIIKADALLETLKTRIDKAGFLESMAAVSRVVSSETLDDVGRKLIRFHQPVNFDFAARFGIVEDVPGTDVVLEPEPPSYVAAPAPTEEQPKCQKCGQRNLSILYGKYGYYFKCADCGWSGSAKVSCGNVGHKERIRKEGRQFFRECAQCGSSSLYFVNPA